MLLGPPPGAAVGAMVGAAVGAMVGAAVGAMVGAAVGAMVGAAVGAMVTQPGRLHEHATALRRAALMAIWQCDALVHASYTAKLPGPVPQGELTLNAIEHFPWAVLSHSIDGAAVVGVAVGVADVGVAVGFAVVGAEVGVRVGENVGTDVVGARVAAPMGASVGFRQLSLLETLYRFTCLTKSASTP